MKELKDSSGQDDAFPFQDQKIKINGFLVFCVGLVSLASCLLGYDIGVMSGAILFIEEDFDLQDWEIEMIIGSLNLVAALGALLAGNLSDRIGRRMTILVSAVIFTIGSIGMALAWEFYSLLFFRFVTGIGVGIGLVLAPLYVAELSPSSYRGSLVSLGEVMINIGILLGYVSNLSLSWLPDHIAWRIMLGLGAVPSILLFIGIYVMPESPRWLVANGKKDEAQRVFEKANYPPEMIPFLLSDIEEMVKIDQESSDWKTVLCCPTELIKTTMIIGVGINFFQQGTGCEAAIYYTPTTLEQAGVDSRTGVLVASMIMGLVKVICIFFPLSFVEKIGRKPFLYLSTLGMMFAHMLSAVAFYPEEPMAILAFFSICLFVGFFSLGIGPINWVITSEIFPLKIRGRAMSFATLVNRVTSGTVALTFLSLSKAITIWGAYLLFAGISFVAFLFVLFVVPETRGKSLEELELMFSKGDMEIIDDDE